MYPFLNLAPARPKLVTSIYRKSSVPSVLLLLLPHTTAYSFLLLPYFLPFLALVPPLVSSTDPCSSPSCLTEASWRLSQVSTRLLRRRMKERLLLSLWLGLSWAISLASTTHELQNEHTDQVRRELNCLLSAQLRSTGTHHADSSLGCRKGRTSHWLPLHKVSSRTLPLPILPLTLSGTLLPLKN